MSPRITPHHPEASECVNDHRPLYDDRTMRITPPIPEQRNVSWKGPRNLAEVRLKDAHKEQLLASMQHPVRAIEARLDMLG